MQIRSYVKMTRLRTLGERIKFLRLENGWSQDELSRLSGVSQASISRVERGELVEPSWIAVAGIENAFGLFSGELISGLLKEHL